MKKLICKLLTMILVAGILFSTASVVKAGSENSHLYKGFQYIRTGRAGKKEGGIYIKNYKGNKKSVTIPQKIGKKTVLEIKSLKGAKKLQKLRLSKGIKMVTLSDAPVLKKVTVPKASKYFSVKNNLLLNKKGTVLKSCPGGLKKVEIPDHVKSIGDNAFYGSNVEKVRLGANIVSVGSYVFYNCKNLVSIELNQNLKSIENSAFYNCIALEAITIPSKVKIIEDFAFAQCKKLNSIIIESNMLEKIEMDAFDGAKNLEHVYMLNLETAPQIPYKEYGPMRKETPFSNTKEGINFYVKNETVAAEWKVQLEDSGVKNANIYAGDKLVYTGIN